MRRNDDFYRQLLMPGVAFVLQLEKNKSFAFALLSELN